MSDTIEGQIGTAQGFETTLVIGVFVCACGHPKASHRPHGGRRVPLSKWVCRKQGCDCPEYGTGGVTIEVIEDKP